jgi:cytochrome c biogenesis protein CcdA
MNDLWFGISTAIWLGLVSAVSPCPLATNLAAVTYIGRQVAIPRRVLWSGLAYGLGRVAAYVVLGGLITAAILTATSVSSALQGVMAKIIGPLLILIGMLLLNLIPSPALGTPFARRAQRFGGAGVLGAALLGFLCALAFCPVSAALFFGSLIPLSIEQGRGILYPALYGLATALPVVVLGAGLALGAHWAGTVLKQMPRIEKVSRLITGVVFILAGLYLTAKYVFGVI